MKKTFILLFTLLISIAALAFEYTYEGQTLIYEVVDETAKTCKVSYCSNYIEGSVTIPTSAINGKTSYTVVCIGSHAFFGKGLTSIVLPNSITSIEDDAFSECINLNKINIPNSVTKLGKNAFFNCSSLSHIDIPNLVSTIGESAFYKCSSLSYIDIPSSVTTIGKFAFNRCTKLSSIDVSNDNPSYSSLEGILFNKDKTELIAYPARKKDITYNIPNSVKTIAEESFVSCISLKSINIPYSVSSIEDGALTYSNSLININVDEENLMYSSIDGVLFNKEKSIIYLYPRAKTEYSYEVPNTVTTIGKDAFLNCDNLTSIEIPNSVTTISKYAFAACDNLVSIELPNSLIIIEERSFEGCVGLTSITIPNSVTTIGELAFRDCDNLISVVIPNSVIIIGERAFDGCGHLERVLYSADNPVEFPEDIFKSYSQPTLYVKETAIDKIKSTHPWSLFERFEVYDFNKILVG